MLQWKRNNYYIILVCFCCLRYPAYNVYALYSHLWPIRLYSIFSTLRHKSHGFRKKIAFNMLWFSLQLLSETFSILRRTQRDAVINICWSLWRNFYACQILMKSKFSLQIVKKYSNLQIHKNLSCGVRFVPCGRTDG